MHASIRTVSIAAAALVVPAYAQSSTVEIDLDGVVIDFPNPPDVSRNSLDNPAPGSDSYILPANGYAFSINGLLQLRDPLFGLPLGDPVLLTDLLDQIEPGNSRLLSGWIRNQAGGLPPGGITAWRERFEGGAFGAELGIDLEITVSEPGVVTFAVENITSSLGGLTPTMDFIEGSTTLGTWVPSAPQVTEWHFDGDFAPAAGSDNSAIRFLDDAAFGPILGGLGSEDVFPNPPTPTGVTAAQSGFVDTAVDPNLPAVGGVDAMAFRTSPAYNQADPGNSAWRRGIGLALYPAAKPDYPGGFIGQWSMVWDMLIPSSSWWSDYPTNTVHNQYLAALVQDQHNNASGADLWLRYQNGSPVIVYSSDGDNFTGDMPLNLAIAPDTWFRLAVVVDEFQTGRTKVYLNGTYIGETLSDWVYNAVDPTPGEQYYGDGEAVDPANWAAWGEFPSPWSFSSGVNNPDPDTGDPVPTPLASTFCLFSDLRFGGSQPVYVANMLFVDDLLDGADVVALGGPSGDGIMLTGGGGCNAADIAEPYGVLDLSDISGFISAFLAHDPAADIAPPQGVFDLADLSAFIQAFLAGCP
ncbi:MAG: hypothetical protein H6810_08375 [Phycisphaeraceae bacterium]|nr:MAG: hypothetical protein H6810_08375 [Phycisphaeraceae bacterium]